MKQLFYILVIVNTSLCTYGQKQLKGDSLNCLEVASELAYYWRLDSLANNGFRLYTYSKFLKCPITLIYADILVTKLGRPNEIWRTNKGVEYIYYYFDIKAMPKKYNAPNSCAYISFKFDNDRHHLIKIEAGDMDRWE